MYKTIIELKEDTKKEDIAKIRQLCMKLMITEPVK